MLSNNRIIAQLGIGKTTFYKNMTQLTNLGVVTPIENGYIINHLLFPSKDREELEAYNLQLEQMVAETPSFAEHKVYRAFKKHYQENFANVKMPLSEFKMQLEAGFFTKRTQEKEKKPDVVYAF